MESPVSMLRYNSFIFFSYQFSAISFQLSVKSRVPAHLQILLAEPIAYCPLPCVPANCKGLRSQTIASCLNKELLAQPIAKLPTCSCSMQRIAVVGHCFLRSKKLLAEPIASCACKKLLAQPIDYTRNIFRH